MDERGDGRHESIRINRTTLTAQLEEALRADILEGVLRPGQRIRANEMTERYGVSATPLREALQRLAVENLVELDPRLGATVAAISADDLTDIYEMLQLLDGLALECSIERGDEAWVAGMTRSFERLASALERQEAVGNGADDVARRRIGADVSTAHWEFHRSLYAACDSPWLMRFVSQLHEHAERYRRLAMNPASGERRNSRREHERILQAAKRRDREAAVKALREHLALTVKLLREDLDRAGDLRRKASPPA